MPGARRGPGRPFPKGHRSPGRPKGRKDNRTIVREYIGLSKSEFLEKFEKGDAALDLPSRQERIARLLNGAASVAAPLERELMLHSWGRPKETVEITGKLDVTSAIDLAFRRNRARKP